MRRNTVSKKELACAIVLTIIYAIILVLSLLAYFKVVNFTIASVNSFMLSTYCLAFMPLLLIFYATSDFNMPKAVRVIMFIVGVGGSIGLATFNNMSILSNDFDQLMSLIFVASPYIGCIAYAILFGYPRISKRKGKIADIMGFVGESPILRVVISILIIPLAIVIGAVALIAFFIFIFLYLFAVSRGSNNKQTTVYIVNDGGYDRKLTLFDTYLKDYDSDSPGYQKMYRRYKDDVGNYWRSYDEGKTFIKEKYNGKNSIVVKVDCKAVVATKWLFTDCGITADNF